MFKSDLHNQALEELASFYEDRTVAHVESLHIQLEDAQRRIQELQHKHRKLEHEVLLGQTLMTCLGEVVIVLDDEGYCVQVNPIATSRTGLDVGDSFKQWCTSHLVLEGPRKAKIPDHFNPLLRACKGEYIERDEIWIVDKVRGSWWAEVRAISSGDGSMVVLMRDITQIKFRNKTSVTKVVALETHKLLEQMSKTLNVGIVQWSPPNDTIHDPASTLSEVLFGWTSLQEWWDGVKEFGRWPATMECSECGSPEHIGVVAVDMVDSNGEVRVYELHFLGHAHQINPIHMRELIIIDEITSQRDIEDELQHVNEELADARDKALSASSAKSAFLADMSHELRTPLNAIIGYSELLLEEADFDQRLQDFQPDIQKIQRAGQQLLELIGGVLDLSKIEAGRMDVYAESVDLTSLIETLRTTVEPMLKMGVELKIEVPNRVGVFCSDKAKLRQILLNLLSNASKFTTSGSVTLRIEECTSQPRILRFAVQDTGIGIPKEKQRAIFEAFQQASSDTQSRFGGTGLGMTIAQRFTQLLGGTGLEIESKVGKGTTFSLTIPELELST